MMEIIKPRTVWDVAIIGSGAGGGMAAKVLADHGATCIVLEAGLDLSPAADFLQHRWPYDLPYRGFPLPGIRGGLAAPGLFAWSDDEPYTTSSDGGPAFCWYRSRVVGGRTNQFSRLSPRMAAYDFCGHSIDGYGHDWPISYDDVTPYYAKVESLIGVSGSQESLVTVPDGKFLPPVAPRCVDRLIQKACEHLDIQAIPSRVAVLTQALNGRGACHYCGQCDRGCIHGAAFSSSQVLLHPLVRERRIQLLTNAMARELVVDDEANIVAVSYIDKLTGQEHEISCHNVVLAASACESARLLLNSKSSRFPTGLANSSNLVGRRLTDTVKVTATVHLPYMEGLEAHNHDGLGASHMFCPWWLRDHQRQLKFPRGYHIEFGGGPTMPQLGMFQRQAIELDGYGINFKRKLRQRYGSLIYLAGRGEMIPNKHCYCEIDPSRIDRWGIPVLRFYWKWGEPELCMAEHMRHTLTEIASVLGGEILPGETTAAMEMGDPGSAFHELGTLCMGNDPATSVLNRYGQAHDVSNLFVADGSVFSSHPEKNPTLTIMALAWRSMEHLIQHARGNHVQ